MTTFYGVYHNIGECDHCHGDAKPAYGMGGPSILGDVIAYCIDCLRNNGSRTAIKAHERAGHIPKLPHVVDSESDSESDGE